MIISVCPSDWHWNSWKSNCCVDVSSVREDIKRGYEEWKEEHPDAEDRKAGGEAYEALLRALRELEEDESIVDRLTRKSVGARLKYGSAQLANYVCVFPIELSAVSANSVYRVSLLTLLRTSLSSELSSTSEMILVICRWSHPSQAARMLSP